MLAAGGVGLPVHLYDERLVSAVGGSTAGELSRPLRVLVLDGWEPMALGACRGVGHAGHHVGVAGLDRRREMVAHSRFVRRYDTLPDPWGPAAPYEAALRDLIERERYDAVVSVHDQTLARLASIDLPIPTTARLDDAWKLVQDKRALAEVSERVGIPYPRTEAVSTTEEVEAAVERLGLPVFVKSAVSALALPDRVEFARGAKLARTREEAVAAAEQLFGKLPVIVQSLIDRGTKLGVVVLRRDGKSEIRYAHRMLREHPREGGIGITLESLDPDSGDGNEAITALERICEEVGYHGIVHAEVYRDESEGVFVPIDINPRVWGGIWFVERQGVYPLDRSLRAALDLPPRPPYTPRPGLLFHMLIPELGWLRREPDRRAALREWLRTTRPRDVFDLVDVTDPMPTLRYLADRVRRVPKSPAGPQEP
jgi:predicted ATP-grasp superfamily ATP-dependent carboligase